MLTKTDAWNIFCYDQSAVVTSVVVFLRTVIKITPSLQLMSFLLIYSQVLHFVCQWCRPSLEVI